MTPRSRLALGTLSLLSLLAVAWWRLSERPSPPPAAPVATAPHPGPSSSEVPAPATADRGVLRPLAADLENARHAWTREDGKSPEIIEKLANHPDQFTRMIEENDRIKRRQLVYRKEPVALLLEQARAAGRPLTRITLPAMDGREVEVEIMESQIDGHRGALMGRVVGRLDSVACVGFSGACESFNILSPQDGLYIAAEAREAGEIILKEIDPAVYSPLACGGPLTAQN